MSELVNRRTWHIATAIHLSGAGAFGIASYWDRHGHASGLAFDFLVGWGLLMLVLGPAFIFMLVGGRRLVGWQATAAIGVAIAVEVTQVIAMTPLIQ
jgi:hypothetical protein